MKTLVCILLAVLLARVASAATTASHTGTHVTVVSWGVHPSDANVILVNLSWSVTNPPAAASCAVAHVSGDGVQGSNWLFAPTWHANPTSGTAQISIVKAPHIWLALAAERQGVGINWAWVDVGVPMPLYWFNIGHMNNTEFPQTIRLKQDGGQLGGEIILQPGQGISQNFSSSSNTPVTKEISVSGVNTDGNTWYLDGGATRTATPPGSVTPTAGTGPGGVTPPAEIPKLDSATQPPLDLPTQAPTQNANKTVWNTNSAPTAGVDSQTYREGVDKVVAAVKASGGSGGGGTTNIDLSATNAKLESIRAALADGAAQTAGEWPKESTEKLGMTKAAVEGFAALVPEVPNVLPTTITPTSHFTFELDFGGGSSGLLQKGLGKKTVDINMAPYGTAVTFLRGTMLAILGIAWFLMVVSAVKGAFA